MRFIFKILILIFINLTFNAYADINKFRKEMEPALQSFKQKDYSSAFDIILPLSQSGNPIATHYLGIMSYFGLHVKKNLDLAASAFRVASKDGKEGGYVDSMYWLARNFYLIPESKYYNLREGYKLLINCEMAGHPEGTFHKALQMIKRIDKSQNPELFLDKITTTLNKAIKLGVEQAKFFSYVVEREQIQRGFRDSYTTIDFLKEFSSKQNQSQAHAAYELAILYKNGKYIEKNLSEYMRLLQVAVDEGNNPDAAYYLGKAYLLGMNGDPDYSSAKFYLEYAKKNKIKAAEIELKILEREKKEELALNSYEPKDDWYENFLIMQSFATRKTVTRNNTSSSTSTNFDSLRENLPIKSSRMTTYRRTGNSIWGSDGSSFRITGNNIRSSNGTNYRITGNNIRGSDGTSYRITGNSIRSSDGTRYRITGNSIRGSDGTRCRTTGKTTRCY